jgi:hypothetical protein
MEGRDRPRDIQRQQQGNDVGQLVPGGDAGLEM